jgi:hypothetical protein
MKSVLLNRQNWAAFVRFSRQSFENSNCTGRTFVLKLGMGCMVIGASAFIDANLALHGVTQKKFKLVSIVSIISIHSQKKSETVKIGQFGFAEYAEFVETVAS